MGPREQPTAANEPHLPARVLGVFREKGLAGVWIAALAQAGFRRLVVLERRLDEPPSQVAPRIAAEIRRLRIEDLPALAALAEGEAGAARARMALGHECWGAWCGGELRHAAWTAFSQAWVEPLGCRLHLAADAAYTYRAFTDPRFRRLGLTAAAHSRCLQALAERGCSRSLCAVAPENPWAFGPWLKVGYRRIAVLSTLGTPFGRWAHVRVDQGGSPQGWSVERFQDRRALREHAPMRAGHQEGA